MEIDRLTARVDVDTARANASIKVLDKNLDEAAEDRTAVIHIVEDDQGNLNFLKDMKKGKQRYPIGFDVLGDDLVKDIDLELKKASGTRNPVSKWVSMGFTDGAASAIRKFEGGGFGKMLTLAMPNFNEHGGIFDIRRNRRNGGFDLFERGTEAAAEAIGTFTKLGDAVGKVGDIATEAGEQVMGLGAQVTDLGTEAGGTGSKVGGSMASGLSGGAIAAATLLATLVILIPALTALGTALLAAGTYVVGLVAALAPLVGVLGLLPGLALGAGGAMAVLFGAFKDILPAIQEVTQAEEDQEKNTIALASAERSLTQAERQRADAVREYAFARRDAAEAIEDAQFAARAAQLSEERAILGLERAYQRLQDVQDRVGDSTKEIVKVTDDFTGKQFEVARITFDAVDAQEDIRDATLGVKEAELALLMAKDRRSDTEIALNEIMAKGIENSDILVARTRALEDAEWAVEQAMRARKDMQDQLNPKEDEDSKYGGLAPAAQEFVDIVTEGLKPIWDQFQLTMQETLMPYINDALNEILPFLEEIGTMLEPVAEGLGQMVASFTENFFTDENEEMMRDFFTDFGKHLGMLGPIFADLASGFLALIIASKPLVEAVMEGFADLATRFREWAEGDSSMGDLEPWFEQTGETLRKVFEIFFNLMEFMTGFLTGAEEFSTWVLDGLVNTTQEMSDWANSDEGQEDIKSFFERMKPAVQAIGDLMAELAKVFIDIFSSEEAVEFLVDFVEHLKNDVLPLFSEFMMILLRSGIMSAFLELVGGIMKITMQNWDMMNLELGLTLVAGVMEMTAFLFDAIAGMMKLFNDINPLNTGMDMITGWLQAFQLDELLDELRIWFSELPDKALTWMKEAMPDFSGLWDGIKAAFIDVINGILDVWNNLEFTLPSFDGKVFGQKVLPAWDGPTLGIPEDAQIPLLSGGTDDLNAQRAEEQRLANTPWWQGGTQSLGDYQASQPSIQEQHPYVTINNTFSERVDSHEVINDMAWGIGQRTGPR